MIGDKWCHFVDVEGRVERVIEVSASAVKLASLVQQHVETVECNVWGVGQTRMKVRRSAKKKTKSYMNSIRLKRDIYIIYKVS